MIEECPPPAAMEPDYMPRGSCNLQLKTKFHYVISYFQFNDTSCVFVVGMKQYITKLQFPTKLYLKVPLQGKI